VAAVCWFGAANWWQIRAEMLFLFTAGGVCRLDGDGQVRQVWFTAWFQTGRTWSQPQ